MSCFAMWLLWPNIAGAEPLTKVWSWTQTEPTVFASDTIADIGRTYCNSALQMKDIEGRLDKGGVCLTEGKKLSFGTTSFWWFGSGGVVAFPYDSKMYKFNGGCTLWDTCTYLPESDTLIVKQPASYSWFARSFVVYKNFSKRLKPAVYGLTKQYDFDDSNPDYKFQDAQNRLWAINSTGVSKNGKWVAVEFWNRGIGLFNTETLEMRRVTSFAHMYGYGMDPTTDLAVTNDGNHIAVMGLNSGLSVYDITPDCGEVASYEVLQTNAPMVNQCPGPNINSAQFINGFNYALYPRFNEDGGELNFYAQSYRGDIREVTMRAGGYVGQRLDYLAMGDSFTSGEGETDDKYYLPGTNEEYEKCHLSSRSYPYLVAQLSGIEPAYIKSVACSGAETRDVVGEDKDYLGQKDRLGPEKLNLDNLNTILAKTTARYEFIPGRIHQITFATEYRPKVVTIGVGGNDAGLMNKLTACAGSGTCGLASDAKEKEQAAKEIKNIFDKLVTTYKAITYASPKTKIYAIGYPQIVDIDGNCDSVTGYLFDRNEREYMSESVIYLNQVVEAAAKAAGVKYINVQDSYGNQVLCGSKSPSAMNGVRTGDDSNLVDKSQWFRFIGNEGFHPNSFGHALTAMVIHETVGDLTSYSNCPDGAATCPDDTVKAPEPSIYWVPNGYHDYPAKRFSNFVADSHNTSDSLDKTISVDDYSFQPNSWVTSEVTSNPISLGQFQVTNTGSLNTAIALPPELEEGYHTMHLYGTSYSGEPIELYQVFMYAKPLTTPGVTTPTNITEAAKRTSVTTGAGQNDSQPSDALNANSSFTDDMIASVSQTPSVKGARTRSDLPAGSKLAASANNFSTMAVIFGTLAITTISVLTLLLRRFLTKKV